MHRPTVRRVGIRPSDSHSPIQSDTVERGTPNRSTRSAWRGMLRASAASVWMKASTRPLRPSVRPEHRPARWASDGPAFHVRSGMSDASTAADAPNDDCAVGLVRPDSPRRQREHVLAERHQRPDGEVEADGEGDHRALADGAGRDARRQAYARSGCR